MIDWRSWILSPESLGAGTASGGCRRTKPATDYRLHVIHANSRTNNSARAAHARMAAELS
jgi:hypothetical protein